MQESKEQKDVATEQFALINAAFAKKPLVTQGKMFGSTAMKVDGKVFAMVVKGKFVAKLPATRIAVLIKEVDAENFDPGHGKLMKEWVAVSNHHHLWLNLATEAYQFVKGAKS
jgi:TfoX/Sxy family transcriptional regulator of competence genes